MSKKKAGDSSRTDNSTTLASAIAADEYKVIIIGALGAGKTSLLLRFVHDSFEDRVSRFVSEERKTITVGGKEVVLDIWDTAGQERFQSITNRFYQETHAVLIVYDLTSEESFRDVDFWIREVQYYLPQELDKGMPVIFVGNKKDLVTKRESDHQKVINSRQVQELANAHGFLPPIECSAKTGSNVTKIFQTVGSYLVEQANSPERGPKIHTQKKKCCN